MTKYDAKVCLERFLGTLDKLDLTSCEHRDKNLLETEWLLQYYIDQGVVDEIRNDT